MMFSVFPTQQDPHGGLRICDSVRKLLEAVEQHHENQRSKQYQVIRYYQRHQFLGLPQTLHIEVDHRHDESKKQSHQDIRHQTAPQRLPRFRKTAVAVKTAALTRRVGGEEKYMMTGGVSKNKGLVKTLEEKLGTKLVISDKAQLCGALGAALFAADMADV